MRTGMGTRAQPMMIAVTTAGDDPASFARSEHDECVRIVGDPERARHRFAYSAVRSGESGSLALCVALSLR